MRNWQLHSRFGEENAPEGSSAAAEKGPPVPESTEGRKNKEGEIQSMQKCCLTIPHSSFAASGMENRAELISTWL